MRPIDPVKAGLVLGILFGGVHLGWALLVAAGWAQPVVDFVFRMHFIKPIYVIAPFDLASAAILVVLTTITGSVFAFAFASLWNNFHRI